jgi:glycosyltransferase involved in cell wall biosynthesis
MPLHVEKVSIIIPVYNGANYLREAIDSALAQTYVNIEVIVVNDGSTDDGMTERIAKSYGDKVHYISKSNGGVASALNVGIKHMKGEFFSWLSHDDLYHPDKIKDQIALLSTLGSPNAIVASNSWVLFEDGSRKRTKIDSSTFRFFDIFLATSANVGVNGCTLLIPRKAFNEIGFFNESLPVTQDYDMWFRLKEKYSFHLIEKSLVTYRRHDMQDSVTKQSMMKNAEDDLHARLLESIESDRYDEYLGTNKKSIKKFKANYDIYQSRGYVKTANIMLGILLRYYYNHNKEQFVKIFKSDVVRLSYGKYAISNNEAVRIVGGQPINVRIQDITEILREMQYRSSTSVDTSRVGDDSTSVFQALRRRIIEDGVIFTAMRLLRKAGKLVKRAVSR